MDKVIDESTYLWDIPIMVGSPHFKTWNFIIYFILNCEDDTGSVYHDQAYSWGGSRYIKNNNHKVYQDVLWNNKLDFDQKIKNKKIRIYIY